MPGLNLSDVATMRPLSSGVVLISGDTPSRATTAMN
jgi:hypothetical protein